MLKKVIGYQKLLNRSHDVNGTLFVPVVLVMIFLNSVIRSTVGLNVKWALVAIIVFTYAYEVILTYPKKLMRSLPVSDKFAVANLLFVSPVNMLFYLVLFSFILFSLLGAFVAIAGRITAMSYMDTTFLTDIYHIMTIDNLCKIIFVCCVYFGLWCLIGFAAFHKNRIVRWEIIILSLLIVYGSMFLLCYFAKKNTGIHGELTMGNLIEVYNIPVMLLAGIVFAVVSGCFAWRKCLKLYRTDISGQAKYEQNLSYDTSRPVVANRTGSRKTVVIMFVSGVFACIAVIGFILFGVSDFSSGEKQKVNIETHDSSQYQDWQTIDKICGLPEDMTNDYVTTLFPETINPKQTEEYYAKGSGSYVTEVAYDSEDGWSGSYSMGWMRYLVLNLSEQEFEQETKRLANHTVTYKGEEKVEKKTNHVLKDTRHFAYPAYIAVWDESSDNYEYALADEKNHTIIYVFTFDDSYRKIKSKYSICPRNFEKVISLKNANDLNRAFSIYSFWNEEEQCYYYDKEL